jgi:hypothetical protein
LYSWVPTNILAPTLQFPEVGVKYKIFPHTQQKKEYTYQVTPIHSNLR